MKKLLLSFSLFVACVCGANAADNLTVNNISNISVDDDATISVALSNTETKYYGIQFDVELPDGFSLTTSNDKPVVTSSTRLSNFTSNSATLDATYVGYRVLAYATSQIEAGSGNLFSMTLNTTKTSGQYTGYLSNIVFVNSDYSSVKMGDVSFTITVKDKEITRITLDEDSETAPELSSTPSYYTINRSITAGKWSTLVLPFSLTPDEITTAFGSNTKFAELESYTVGDLTSSGAGSLGINVTNYDYTTDGIAANHPYFIKTASSVSVINTIEQKTITSVDNMVVDISSSSSSDQCDKGTFQGVYIAKNVPAQRLFISNNAFYYSKGSATIKAFRAYVYLPYVLSSYWDTTSSSKVNIIYDGDDVTGISDVNASNETNSNAKIYNISGQYVGNDVNSLSSGLYIQNGKKFSVK